eukprot:g8335.t1
MQIEKIIEFAASLSQFFPAITQWLSGERGEIIAPDIVAIAKSITGELKEQQIVSKLAQHPQLLLEFRRNDEGHRTRNAEPRGRKNLRADIMVVSAAVGMALCLLALGIYRQNLPGEAVGIISTIAGIFGSCLKDAYAFEFGSSRGSKDKDETVASFMQKNFSHSFFTLLPLG